MDPRAADPDLPEGVPLPIIHNDHDWTTCAPLVERLTDEKASALRSLQKEFADQCYKDGDMGIADDLDVEKLQWMTRRVCTLCPKGFGLVSIARATFTYRPNLPTQNLNARGFRIHVERRYVYCCPEAGRRIDSWPFRHLKDVVDLEVDCPIEGPCYGDNHVPKLLYRRI